MVKLCLLERLEKSYLLVEGRLCVQQGCSGEHQKEKEELLQFGRMIKEILKLLKWAFKNGVNVMMDEGM